MRIAVCAQAVFIVRWCTQLLDPDRRLPSFTRDMALERQGRDGSADDATDEELAEAAGVLATAETARL